MLGMASQAVCAFRAARWTAHRRALAHYAKAGARIERVGERAALQGPPDPCPCLEPLFVAKIPAAGEDAWRCRSSCPTHGRGLLNELERGLQDLLKPARVDVQSGSGLQGSEADGREVRSRRRMGAKTCGAIGAGCAQGRTSRSACSVVGRLLRLRSHADVATLRALAGRDLARGDASAPLVQGGGGKIHGSITPG